MVVEAPRDANNLDTGYYWRFENDDQPEYDEWEFYDPYTDRRWWYDPILEEWNEFDQGYGPTPKVYLELASGSATIDPTESSRKRYLKIRTDPPFPELAITKITKTRKSSPSYGHSHAVDNNNRDCRGATNYDSGKTNKSGVFNFYYRGPKAAGETVVKVEYKFPNGVKGSRSITFISRKNGLVRFTGGTGIKLVGSNSKHPGNHWGTSALNTLLRNVGSDFYKKYKQAIFVNDMSLQYGGLFDINGNWKPEHHEHRTGRNADVDLPPNLNIKTDPKWIYLKERIDAHQGQWIHDKKLTHVHVTR